MTDLGRDIEGRAEAVREWLMGLLPRRGVWLWSELVMAAERECIDLEWFWGHYMPCFVSLEVHCPDGDVRRPEFVRLKPKTEADPQPADTPSRDALAAAVGDMAAKIDRLEAMLRDLKGQFDRRRREEIEKGLEQFQMSRVR